MFAARLESNNNRMLKPSLTRAQQLALCQQVARLVRLRLPLSGGLGPAMEGGSSASAHEVEERLRQGQSLTQILASDDSARSRSLSACIAIGEKCNQLDWTLDLWLQAQLSLARASKAMQTAMIYPLLLILVSFVSLGLLIWNLVPEYRATYALFNAELPNWLAAVWWLRQHFWLLMVVWVALVIAPLVWRFWNYHSFNRDGLPRVPFKRLRLQALSTELLQVGITNGLPLEEIIPLAVRASGANPAAADQAFRRVQQQLPVSPLARENSLLLASLHCGLLSPDETAKHLGEIAGHLERQAETVAARAVRWLPMLVAILVGGVTILSYVFLIYLPWILLLQQIVAPPE